VGRARLKTVLRPVTAADVDAVSEIFAWYVQHTVTTFEETPRSILEWNELRVSLHGLGLPFLVAESDGKVAGYTYASPWRSKPGYRHTVEDSVFVAHGLTGRGIGRLLLGDLLTSCAASGIRQVIAVIADTEDEASTGLHRTFGFADAGRLTRVGYKHERWIDTLLMQRSLRVE
jgi:L-amino acid N-acyltransferase YncA